MLKQLALTAFAAAALGATVANAAPIKSSGCPTWVCGTSGNGTQLTGLALGSASTGTVSAVILPTGEVLDPR